VTTDLNAEPPPWQQFVTTRDPNDRETLIERYTPFATMLAAQLYANRQIPEIEFDEFRQYALVGLVESVDRFDPSRGVDFRAYCSHRIRGAVLNGIERYCEKQQQIAVRSRMRDERVRDLLKEATSVEDPFRQLVDVAIGVAIGFMLEDSGMYRAGDVAHEHNAYKSRELSDLVRAMNTIVDTLPDQEQRVIRYHYFQGVRFDEIAMRLSLTKGRISQIHHRALQRMREHYDHLRFLRTDL
jgi:RNA polymerase sigma factor FliA